MNVRTAVVAIGVALLLGACSDSTSDVADPVGTTATASGTDAPVAADPSVTAEEAIAVWAAEEGIEYLGPCASAGMSATGRCSIEEGGGEYVLGPVRSEPDIRVVLGQDADGDRVVASAGDIADSPVQSDLPTSEIEQLQADCVYEDSADACARLEAVGIGADANYGVGNAMTQAPDELIRQWCADGSALACAEAAFRGVSLTGTDG